MIWSWLWTSNSKGIGGIGLRYRRRQRVVDGYVVCLCREWRHSCSWRRGKVVNSEIVKCTVSKCPSDLIALSFFLWSAQRQRRRHDSVALDRIVTVVHRLTHRHHTVPAILFHLETIGCASLTNPKSQLVLLRIFWRAGRIDEAVIVYCHVVMSYHDTDPHIHTLIIAGLIKTGNYHKAASVFRFAVMNKYPLDTIAYTVGICAFLRDGRTQEACTLYDQMKDNGLKPSVHAYNMILFTFCKERDLQMIKQILQEMIDSRIRLSGRNFSNLCKYICRSDTYLPLLKLLAGMRELGLLSDKHADAVQQKHKHQAEANTEWSSILDSYSSEDLSDVAASVG